MTFIELVEAELISKIKQPLKTSGWYGLLPSPLKKKSSTHNNAIESENEKIFYRKTLL